jgi:hypothetical protein
MFAYDVDAARRGDNPARLASIGLGKLLGNLNG